MTTAEATLSTCPRCNGELVRNHDELLCLVHGTVQTPSRAWDVPSGDGRTGPQGKRGPKDFGGAVAWTDEERRLWATWEEPLTPKVTPKVTPAMRAEWRGNGHGGGMPTVAAVELVRHFDKGRQMTASGLARVFGTTPRTAQRWLATLAPLVPLVHDASDNGAWIWRKA